jgi:hypothetical protein
VAIRKDVLVVVHFQYNAAEQATWGPVIKLMDDPLRLGAGRQPAKDGFSTRSGLCRLSRNKKMLTIQETASRLALLHGVR